MLVAYLKTEVSQGCLKAGADYPASAVLLIKEEDGGGVGSCWRMLLKRSARTMIILAEFLVLGSL